LGACLFAKVLNSTWGQMLLYTNNAESYGTKDGLVALAHVLPGKSAHPEHRHVMEEYLYLVRGEIQAQKKACQTSN